MVMISVLVLLGLGLVTATVLAVASRVFHVEEDPRVQAVLEALPGANCGGCGYAGCEGYATAVATDPAVPANRCCAGGAETSIAVGELTGKTVAASDPLVSFRRCDKVAGNVALRYDYQGMPSCAAAAGLVGGSDSCSYSCLGFGDCVQVCPFDAIEVRGGLARVNASKCTGCGKCAETCPRNVLELVPARTRVMVFCSTKDRLKAVTEVCKVGCIKCGRCVKSCPAGAVTLENDRIHINHKISSDLRPGMRGSLRRRVRAQGPAGALSERASEVRSPRRRDVGSGQAAGREVRGAGGPGSVPRSRSKGECIMMTRRVFLGMAGVAGAGLWLGVPGLAQAAVSRETKVMLGTFVDVSVAGVSSMQASDALCLAFAEASRLERVFSRHDGGTPVSELNRAGRLRAAPAELVRVVNRSLFYGALTGGSFDVTVQPMIDLFRAHRNPSGELTLDDSELRAARALVGRRGLQVSGTDSSFARSGMGITLDGIAKGYIADRVSAVLTSAGVKNHLVNAGGDIMASGHKSPGVPWRVAVQSPTGPTYAGELSLSGKAIATSGSYEIYYDASRRHHHLINPASGFSPAVGSVSVVAGTAMEADTLATALSILPPTDALKLVQGLPGRECCILSPDGCIHTSQGWASFA